MWEFVCKPLSVCLFPLPGVTETLTAGTSLDLGDMRSPLPHLYGHDHFLVIGIFVVVGIFIILCISIAVVIIAAVVMFPSFHIVIMFGEDYSETLN